MSYPQVRLSSIGKTKSGATPYRGKQAEYFSSDGTPWVKTLDLNNGVITETSESVTDLAIKETSITVFPAGTLLIAMYGGFNQIGRTGLLSIAATTNQAITGLKLDDSKIIGYYALQALNHFRFLWRRYAASSRKDPNITRDDVDAFKIPLPDLPTQRRIAAILQTWDRAIQLAEQQLADLQERKRGLMQLLLTGKKRLPEFEGKEEWVKTTLGEIAEIVTGTTPSPSIKEYYGGFIPFVGPGDLDQKYVNSSKKYVTELGAKQSRPVPAGSILVNCIGSQTGKTGYALVEVVTNQQINSVVVNPKITDSYYVYFQLDFSSKYLNYLAPTQAVPIINASDFSIFKIPHPSLTEQEHVSRIFQICDRAIKLDIDKINSLRLQKRGLMQRLLEGEVEVGEEMDEMLGI